MKKVKNRGSRILTTVTSPIGKLGQKTLDAGQTEVKQLWSVIERAFGTESETAREDGGEGAEDQAWEEVAQKTEDVNIFLDHLGSADDHISDLSSSGSPRLSKRHSHSLTTSTGEPIEAKESGGGDDKPGRHQLQHGNSFVVKIKRGKEMAHKIMFSGMEKMTHLGRGQQHHKKKKDDADRLIEPRAVVGLCGKRGAEPALIEVSMGCIISCPLQCQGSMALPKKLKNRRMLTKNTPRVLFGKQEGWVLELYTPQPVSADPEKKSREKEKDKEREKVQKKEEKKREKLEREQEKAKEKESKERLKMDKKRRSTVADAPSNSAPKDERTSEEDAKHKEHEPNDTRDEDKGKKSEAKKDKKEKKDKKDKKDKSEADGGHDTSKHPKHHAESVIVNGEHENGSCLQDAEERSLFGHHNNTDSEGEHDEYAMDTDEWFDADNTEMANWEKLELAARAPQHMMAWKQFFKQGETVDGRKEMAGFLWVKQKDVWDRFYCIADRDNFEWLKPGAANLIPLTTLTNLRRGILTEKEQHKLQAKKKEEWDKSPYLSKIRRSQFKLTLLKQDEPLYSFVTPSKDILVAMATHIIAQKGLNNLVTHNRTLLDEVDSAKAVATNTKYKIKRATQSQRKRSDVRETTLVPIHRRTPSQGLECNTDGLVAPNLTLDGTLETPETVDRPRPLAGRFLDSVGDDSAPSEHYLRKSTIEETKETTKLRNEMRDVHERAVMEKGKTPFGNIFFSKNKKLNIDPATMEKADLKDNKDFFILSLDGGGLRGIILTTLLVRLVDAFPDLMERVDLFAGVSAGSIVASALATGRSPGYMQKMLISLGPLFFMPRNVRQFHGYPLRQAKYSMQNLKIILEESLRGETLETCPRNLLISSFLLDNHKQGYNRSWSPRVYHNLPLNKKDATTSEEEEDEDDMRTSEDAMQPHSARGGSDTRNSAPADQPNRRKNALPLGRARSENKVGRNQAEDMIASAERRKGGEPEAKPRKRRNAMLPQREKRGSISGEAAEPASESDGHDGPASEGKAKEMSPDEVEEEATDATDPVGPTNASLTKQHKQQHGHHRHHSGGGREERSAAQLRLQLPRNSAPSDSSARALTARNLRSADLRSWDDLSAHEPPAATPEAHMVPTTRDRRATSGHLRQASADSMLSGPESEPVKNRRPTPVSNTRPPLSQGLSGSMHNLSLNRKGEMSMSSADVPELAPGETSAPKRSAPKHGKGKTFKGDGDSLVMDLVLASAAAPTFFPSHMSHVDGAIVSNNPSLAAITTVLSPDTIGTPKVPSKVHVLSIGTGYITRFLETNSEHDWGVLQWAPWLSEMMLYSSQLNATQLSATLLGDNYHRLDPQLEEAIPMDDPALLSVLEEKAKEVDLAPTIAWIKRHVYGEKEEQPQQPAADAARRRYKRRRRKQSTAAERTSKRPPKKEKDRRHHDEGSSADDEVPHNNMHWGTDAWFATQRMWEG